MYRSIIIGCGNIGTGFDSLDTDNSMVLTHAKAYHMNPDLTLAGVMDYDREKVELNSKKWGCKGFHDFNQLIKECSPEIISICTPTSTHLGYLEKVLASNNDTKAVVIEKPITDSARDSRRIVEQFKAKGIPLFIPYLRNYDQSVIALREDIAKGRFGRVLQCSVKYAKGIVNNGSHLLNLGKFLFGDIKKSTALARTVDYNNTDPTLNAFLVFDRCPSFFLTSGDERCYTIAEYDIMMEKKRILFENLGYDKVEYDITPSPFFRNYRILERKEKARTSLGKSFSVLMKNVVDVIEGRASQIWPAEETLSVQETCEELIEKSRCL